MLLRKGTSVHITEHIFGSNLALKPLKTFSNPNNNNRPLLKPDTGTDLQRNTPLAVTRTFTSRFPSRLASLAWLLPQLHAMMELWRWRCRKWSIDWIVLADSRVHVHGTCIQAQTCIHHRLTVTGIVQETSTNAHAAASRPQGHHPLSPTLCSALLVHCCM